MVGCFMNPAIVSRLSSIENYLYNAMVGCFMNPAKVSSEDRSIENYLYNDALSLIFGYLDGRTIGFVTSLVNKRWKALSEKALEILFKKEYDNQSLVALPKELTTSRGKYLWNERVVAAARKGWESFSSGRVMVVLVSPSHKDLSHFESGTNEFIGSTLGRFSFKLPLAFDGKKIFLSRVNPEISFLRAKINANMTHATSRGGLLARVDENNECTVWKEDKLLARFSFPAHGKITDICFNHSLTLMLGTDKGKVIYYCPFSY